ncbi:MAG: BatD family protein [Proteobacteria bacterium]|nr:BatD family protein [Pseudomonadota bacterium]
MNDKFIINFLTLVLLLLTIVSNANSQVKPEISIEPAQGTVADMFKVTILFSGADSNIPKPRFDKSDKFNLQSSGKSNQIQIINGQQSTELSYIFNFFPNPDLAPGKYKIPDAEIAIDGIAERLEGPEVTIVASEEQVNNNFKNNTKLGIDFTHIVDNYEPYVGEQLTYRTEIVTNRVVANAVIQDISLNGFLRESYGKNQEQQRRNGDLLLYSVLEGLFPVKSGALEIPSRAFTANIEVPLPQRPRSRNNILDELFDDVDIFRPTQLSPIKLNSETLKLNVKELPPAPSGVKGYVPVGSVKVSSSIDLTKVIAGESLTLTIEIQGDANLRPYELPTIEGKDLSSFKIYNDKPSIDVFAKNNRLYFKKTYKIAIIPLVSGNLELPYYKITAFDPSKQKYFTFETEHKEVIVNPAKQEHIVAFSNDEKTLISNNNEKTEIKLSDEDFRAIHKGSYLEDPAFKYNNYLNLLYPLLAGMTYLTYLLTKRNERSVFNPHIRTSKNALSKLNSKLETANDANDILKAVKTYFGEKLGLTGESITSSDIESILNAKNVDPSITDKCKNMFIKLQNQIYGGLNPSDEIKLSSFKSEIGKIINDFDKNFK